MRHIQDDQNRATYLAGYDSKIAEIRADGWEKAREKFNTEYPIGQNISPLIAYFFASGEIDALVDEI